MSITGDVGLYSGGDAGLYSGGGAGLYSGGGGLVETGWYPGGLVSKGSTRQN